MCAIGLIAAACVLVVRIATKHRNGGASQQAPDVMMSQQDAIIEGNPTFMSARSVRPQAITARGFPEPI